MTFFFKKHIGIIFATGCTLLILWTMLVPGYILSLDMVFTPHIPFSISSDGFNNSVPLTYLIHVASLVMPGWVVEKIILIALFFLLSFISYTYLPVPEHKRVKLFAALLYTVNPFVYTRLLAGQWMHLFAYALLPFFIHTLLGFTVEPSFKKCFKLFGSLFFISIFSIHFFLMTCIIAALWIIFSDPKKLFSGTFMHILSTGFFLFLIATSYWTIPSLIHHHPVTTSFTEDHWQAFAPAAHGKIPVLQNLASFNGFWGEGQIWSHYFAWPQEHMIFWIALACVYALVIVGLVSLYKLQKSYALFFLICGIGAFILSTGVAATPFQAFNYFLYRHMPFWSGFRDSQKFMGIVVLALLVCAGYGYGAIIHFLKQKQVKGTEYIITIFFILPIILGMYMWGGYAKQLRSVQYPATWYEAKAYLDAHKDGSNVLILPWQGYLSFTFTNKLIIANPSEGFFGDRAIVSTNFRLGGIYDQTTDATYNELDTAIRTNTAPQKQTMAAYLISKHIGYILKYKDLDGVDTLNYTFLQKPGFKKILDNPELVLYTVQVDH